MKEVKEKIKGKAKAMKKKIKSKIKGKTKCKAKKAAVATAVVAMMLCVCGCLETQPASRATTATYGDVVIRMGEKSHHNTVEIKLGDGAIASADSTGSTETQTATPSMSIPVRVDARYNDAVKSGGDALTALVESLTPAAKEALNKAVSEKYTGTLELEKTDGSKVQVECKDGVCTECADCVAK